MSIQTAFDQAHQQLVKALGVPPLEVSTCQEQEPTSGMPTTAEIRPYASEASHVAWLAATQVHTSSASSLYSLSSWTGPQLYVPHLLVRVAVEYSNHGNTAGQQQQDAIDVLVHYCPRLYAAWELGRGQIQEDSFPPPASRDAFVTRGRRQEQRELYFTQELVQWADSVRRLPGATVKDLGGGDGGEDLGEYKGPICLSLSFPLQAQESVAQIVTDATRFYQDWMLESQGTPHGSVKSMMTYSYDVKTRPAWSQYLEHDYVQTYGLSLGSAIAEADAGPPDLADRSAAMTQAALTNFEIDHMVEATEKD